MIERWKTAIEERLTTASGDHEGLLNSLKKIAFAKRPDYRRSAMKCSTVMCPGTEIACQMVTSGTIGSVCSISSEDNDHQYKQYAITCVHVVGGRGCECHVLNDNAEHAQNAMLGKSDVLIGPGKYKELTLDICAIEVENDTLQLKPFVAKDKSPIRVSPLQICSLGSNIVQRRVQKIATGKTYGRVKNYILRLRISDDDTNIVHELFNVIEVSGLPDEAGKITHSPVVVTAGHL